MQRTQSCSRVDLSLILTADLTRLGFSFSHLTEQEEYADFLRLRKVPGDRDKQWGASLLFPQILGFSKVKPKERHQAPAQISKPCFLKAKASSHALNRL